MTELPQANLPDDVLIQHEPPDKALVVCQRCNQTIGRIQAEPTTPAADQEQVRAEVRLIADEHRKICHGKD